LVVVLVFFLKKKSSDIFQVWTRTVEQCEAALQMRHEVLARLEARAAQRRNKRAALDLFRSQQHLLDEFYRLVLVQANDHVLAQRAVSLNMMRLFNASGAALACLQRNEVAACFEIVRKELE
jgi:hypothetical protein